jgi:hypothetical protein
VWKAVLRRGIIAMMGTAMTERLSALRLKVLLVAALAPTPVAAQRCEYPVGKTGRLLLPGSGTSGPVDVQISEEGEGDYEAWWTGAPDQIAGLQTPTELEFTINWRLGAPPPPGSTLKIFLDGKEALTFTNQNFDSDHRVSGETRTVRRQDGEAVPNIHGHRTLAVIVEKPSGEVYSSRTYRLPRWATVRRQIRVALERSSKANLNCHWTLPD